MTSNALDRPPCLDLIGPRSVPKVRSQELAELKEARRKTAWSLIKNGTGAVTIGVLALGSGALSWLAWSFALTFPVPIVIAFAIVASILCGISTLVSAWFARDAIDDIQARRGLAIPSQLLDEAETEGLLEISAEKIDRLTMSYNSLILRVYADNAPKAAVADLESCRDSIAVRRLEFDEHLRRYRAIIAPPIEPKALSPGDDWGDAEEIDPDDSTGS